MQIEGNAFLVTGGSSGLGAACVRRLVAAGALVVAADVSALRAVGFRDRDILDIAEVTAYYAYVNRIADGLGVPTEDWIPE